MASNKRPELSLAVVIPHRNHGDVLPRAVDALLRAQRNGSVEIHVVDDASDDEHRAVVRRLEGEVPSLHALFLEHQSGAVGAMNAGLKAVAADLVYFGAADDEVEPGLLDTARSAFQDHPEAGLFSARVWLDDTRGRRVISSPSPIQQDGWVSPENARRTLFREDSWMVGNSTVYRRDCLEEIGGFDEPLLSFCDGFASRLIAVRWGAVFDERPLAIWRRDDHGYASRVNSDLDLTLTVLEASKQRILSLEPTYFPAEYADRWSRRWLAGALFFQLDRGVTRFGDRRLQHWIAPIVSNAVDRLKDFGSIGRIMAKALLAIQLRPFDIRVFLQRRLTLRPK